MCVVMLLHIYMMILSFCFVIRFVCFASNCAVELLDIDGILSSEVLKNRFKNYARLKVTFVSFNHAIFKHILAL